MEKIELTIPDNVEDLFYFYNCRNFHLVIKEHLKQLQMMYKETKNPIYLHLLSELKARYEATVGMELK